MDDRDDNSDRIRFLRSPPLEVDLAEGRLRLGGETVHLGGRAFRLLCTLMERPDRVLSKDDLIATVWENRSVSDAVLTTTMKELRRALNDPARTPVFIGTVHGRGYRFLAPVERVRDEEPARAAVEAAEDPRPMGSDASAPGRRGLLNLGRAAVALLVLVGFSFLIVGEGSRRLSGESMSQAPDDERMSIAVLPFDDFSADQSQQWFADGLVEEIVNALTRAPHLRVAGRTSTFAFAQGKDPIAALVRELHVENILEGSVRISEERLRVTVQLINARDRSHVWSHTYDRPRSEIIDVQEAIAADVAKAMGLALDSDALRRMVEVGTSSVAAYEAYLSGLSIAAEAGRTGRFELYDESYQAFERARQEDPEFAAAHFEASAYWRRALRPSYFDRDIAALDLPKALQDFHDRIDAAIKSESDPIVRTRYKAFKAEGALRFREQLRLLESYLQIHKEDLDIWSAYAAAALSLGERGKALAAGRRLADLVAKTGELETRAVTMLTLAGAPAEAAAAGFELLSRMPEQAIALYQTHRALLADGRVDEARELLPRVLASDLPSENLILANLRQACAEGRVDDAARIAEPLVENSKADLARRWLALTIMNRRQEAVALLRPLDTSGRLLQLSSFLIYPQFSAADYPGLNEVLIREGALDRVRENPGYTCRQ